MSMDVQINDAQQASSAMTLPSIPPLENDDYLTRDEFERRHFKNNRTRTLEKAL